ncbi:MAG TPA: metalloregulator ArsR/SmtB family transcription factor [Rhizomicrobium sp.]|jgi:DNA-binding transcriptional ArsR family regulator|nr:metalloregulator ArsR/SmtB family transcription factor [Rhizomicrobium sp.]
MAKSHAQAAAFRSALQIFHLFGEPTRVVIFQRLARQPMSAGELAQTLPVTRPAVVQHLKVLEAAHLLTAHSEGKRRVYSVRPVGLAPLRDWLDRHSPTDQKTAYLHK